jgi:hypothetical protein
MQLKSAFCQPLFQLLPQPLRLQFRTAMADDIICVPLERNGGTRPFHPRIDRVMQEEIRQQGANHGSLRRPFLSILQTAIRHSYRCYQPPFDVQQYPFAIRVLPYGPHQQFVVYVVKETLDVHIQNPGVLPAPLPCFAYGIQC